MAKPDAKKEAILKEEANRDQKIRDLAADLRVAARKKRGKIEEVLKKQPKGMAYFNQMADASTPNKPELATVPERIEDLSLVIALLRNKITGRGRKHYDKAIFDCLGFNEQDFRNILTAIANQTGSRLSFPEDLNSALGIKHFPYHIIYYDLLNGREDESPESIDAKLLVLVRAMEQFPKLKGFEHTAGIAAALVEDLDNQEGEPEFGDNDEILGSYALPNEDKRDVKTIFADHGFDLDATPFQGVLFSTDAPTPTAAPGAAPVQSLYEQVADMPEMRDAMPYLDAITDLFKSKDTASLEKSGTIAVKINGLIVLPELQGRLFGTELFSYAQMEGGDMLAFLEKLFVTASHPELTAEELRDKALMVYGLLKSQLPELTPGGTPPAASAPAPVVPKTPPAPAPVPAVRRHGAPAGVPSSDPKAVYQKAEGELLNFDGLHNMIESDQVAQKERALAWMNKFLDMAETAGVAPHPELLMYYARTLVDLKAIGMALDYYREALLDPRCDSELSKNIALDLMRPESEGGLGMDKTAVGDFLLRLRPPLPPRPAPARPPIIEVTPAGPGEGAGQVTTLKAKGRKFMPLLEAPTEPEKQEFNDAFAPLVTTSAHIRRLNDEMKNHILRVAKEFFDKHQGSQRINIFNMAELSKGSASLEAIAQNLGVEVSELTHIIQKAVKNISVSDLAGASTPAPTPAPARPPHPLPPRPAPPRAKKRPMPISPLAAHPVAPARPPMPPAATMEEPTVRIPIAGIAAHPAPDPHS